MKKIITLISIFVAAFSCVCIAQEKAAPMDKKAQAKFFKDSIKRAENGDTIVDIASRVDSSKLKDAGGVSGILVLFLAYVDPDLNFEELGKAIDKATGGKKGVVPIAQTMAGISKYLGRNNMQLQKVGFSGNNVIQRIEDGLPLICYMAMSKTYDNEFTKRTQKRASVNDSAAWAKELRSLEMKKIQKSDKVFEKAIITGFNKATGEYQFVGLSAAPIWLTQGEIKALLLESYVLRF